MHIDDLVIRGYGRLADLRVVPSRGLNLFHGPPGCGKTSVLNCLRDALLGPGQWHCDDGGPHGELARPRGGSPFVARVTYSVGPMRYTLMRDLADGTTRVRDDRAGAELAVSDPRAPGPGLAGLHLETDDREVEVASSGAATALESARRREAEARHEAALHAHRHACAVVEVLGGRLQEARDLRAELDGLRAEVDRNAAWANIDRDARDGVIRAGERMRASGNEIAELDAAHGREKARRGEIEDRLAGGSAFLSISERDVDAVRAFKAKGAGAAAGLEGKQRDLEGFRQKQAEVEQRLAEVAQRFAHVDDHELFEIALADQERDLARTEQLDAKTAEQARHIAARAEAAGLVRRWMLFGVSFLVTGAMILGLHLWLPSESLVGVGGLVMLAGLPMLIKMLIEGGRLKIATHEIARVEREMSVLQTTIEAARLALRKTVEAVGVHTVLEVRTLHRELQALQRDVETVRSYRAVLERDLAEAGVVPETDGEHAAQVLVRCGALASGERVTSAAVETFLERWRDVGALCKERDDIDARLAEGQARRAALVQAEALHREEHERALAQMGVTSESEVQSAVLGRRELERLQARVALTEEKIGAVLHGVDEAVVRQQLDEARATVERFADAHGPDAAAGEDVESVEVLQEKARLAHDAHARLLGEVAALEQVGMTEAGSSTLPAAPRSLTSTSFEDALAEAWAEITSTSLEMRVRETQRRLAVEVRERSEDPWQPPTGLGATSSRLIALLLEGTRARQGGPGVLPAFLDGPLQGLPEAWQQRACDWVVTLSGSTQVFIALASSSERNLLLAALNRRGREICATPLGDLEHLHVEGHTAATMEMPLPDVGKIVSRGTEG